MKKINQAETLILRTRSLRVKLYESANQNHQAQEGEHLRDEEMERFINDLLTMPEVLVKGGVNSRIGKSIKYLLRHQKVINYFLIVHHIKK